MKQNEKKRALGGWDNIYYTVMHKEDGWFLEDGFSESEDKIGDFVNDLKVLVDDYHENQGSMKINYVALRQNSDRSREG